jgi:hypothetical protein
LISVSPLPFIFIPSIHLKISKFRHVS